MEELLALSAAARDTDAVAPLNEATQISLRSGDAPSVHERVLVDDVLAGVALGFADSPTELVVHPGHRRQGLGRALWERAVDAGATHFWAHGDLPGAQALAATVGAEPVRTLLVLRLGLSDAPEPERELPDLRIRAFEEADADGIIAVNAKAFASHPEQGAMDRADFDRRREEPWFDPAGLFVAVRPDGEVVGFHWTKIEDGVGEVYVVGVDPSAHGGGLGTALTARGVRHLWESGVCVVDLYVEGDNAPALAVYHRLGFAEHARDVLYAT
ncbi:mycothiol synthase [Aeromicrobium sp. CF4.19]|uniref:mycothiol synthase n=1 Tax=Aeromicrobium sp. CF4.19 TaxID=3373082 RepID=UPI003EE72EFF